MVRGLPAVLLPVLSCLPAAATPGYFTLVNIGSHEDMFGPKCVTAPGAHCHEDSGNQWHRIRGNEHADSFHVFHGGSDQVCATRANGTMGWALDLHVVCSTDVHKPVVVVHIGRCEDGCDTSTGACADAAALDCPENAGNKGIRANEDPENDAFVVERHGDNVCARRTDGDGGRYSMELQIVCFSTTTTTTVTTTTPTATTSSTTSSTVTATTSATVSSSTATASSTVSSTVTSTFTSTVSSSATTATTSRTKTSTITSTATSTITSTSTESTLSMSSSTQSVTHASPWGPSTMTSTSPLLFDALGTYSNAGNPTSLAEASSISTGRIALTPSFLTTSSIPTSSRTTMSASGDSTFMAASRSSTTGLAALSDAPDSTTTSEPASMFEAASSTSSSTAMTSLVPADPTTPGLSTAIPTQEGDTFTKSLTDMMGTPSSSATATNDPTSPAAAGLPASTSRSSDAASLFAWISELQNSALSLLHDRDSVEISAAGALITAQRLSNASDSQVLAGHALVVVPHDVVASLGGTAAVITALDADAVAMKPQGAVASMLDIDIFAGERRLKISAAPEPFLVTLPDPDGNVTDCLYWDEGRQRWLPDGIAVVARGDGTLTFATSHLTLFAAVVKGFVNAILCAQLGLLSRESVAAVFEGSWFLGIFALLLWAILAALLAACAWSTWLDRQGGAWSDEWFLIPMNHTHRPNTPQTPQDASDSRCSKLFGGCSGMACFVSSDVVRDALDDIASRWCAFFGEARDLLEALFGEVFAESHGLVSALSAAVVGSLLAGSAQRQAAYNLGISSDIVAFVLADKDLGELMADGIAAGVLASQDRRQQQVQAWLFLHQQVLEQVEQHWEDIGRWGKVPAAAWSVFVAVNPLASALLQCRLMPRGMRALFYSCELLGALLLAALFYDASGVALSKKASRECGDELPIWENVGRLLAITASSLLMARLPVMLIASLHDRSFKKLPFERCPEWRRQLRVWEVQDRMIWLLGMAYCLCCVAFLLLFLANVAPEDLPNWGVGTLVQLLEETLVIPLAVGVVVPVVAMLALRLLSACWRMDVAEVLRERREQRQRGGGNWRRLLLSI